MIKDRLERFLYGRPAEVVGEIISYQLNSSLEKRGMARIQIRVDGHIVEQTLPNLRVQNILKELGRDPEEANGFIADGTLVSVEAFPKRPEQSKISLVPQDVESENK